MILVDQFEELFRYKAVANSMDDRDEKAAFVKLLLEASQQRSLPVYVVITMRAEFLGDCARFRDLPETINAGQYLIPRMNRDQRRQAIEGPIRMASATITPRLVQRILNDVGEDPSQLPVMQHALLRTWNHWCADGRPDRPLDFEDYEAVGAFDKAISNHAEEVYADVCASLGEPGPTIVKRLFQRLSDRDQYGRQTRRPTSVLELSEVCEGSISQIEFVVNAFRQQGRSFLSTPQGPLRELTEVDVTHECLLSKWDRLSKDWNPEEDESRRVYLRILHRAQEAGFNPTEGDGEASPSSLHFRDYLTGNILDRSLTWWTHRQPNAAWARRYSYDDQKPLEVSVGDRQFELAKRYLLESKKHAARSRLFRFMTVPALAGVLLTLFAVWTYRQRSENATARELLVEAQLASNVVPHVPGFSTDDPRRSAFKAAESLKHHFTPAAQTILAQALLQLPHPLLTITDRRATDAKFSPNGAWFAIAGQGGVDLYDANRTLVRHFQAESGPKSESTLLFPSNNFFMITNGTGVSIWQHVNQNWEKRQLTCENPITKLAVSGDGFLLAATCGDLHLWTPGGSTASKGDEECDALSALALSSDGTRVAYVCQMKQGWTIRLRELTLQDQHPPVASNPTTVLALLPQESRASVSSDAKSASAPSSQKPFDSSESWSSPQEIRDIQFDPGNADILIIAGSDGSIRSWNPNRPKAQSNSSSWKKRKEQLPQGERQEKNKTSLYRSVEGYTLMTVPVSPDLMSFTQDGGWIAVVEGKHVVKIWDTREISPERLIAHLEVDHNIKAIAVSRTSNHIAVVTDDGLVHLWKLDGTARDFSDLSRLRMHGAYIIAHSFANDTGDVFSGTSVIINTFNGKEVASYPDYKLSDSSFRPLTISRDGKLIAGLVSGAIIVCEFSDGTVGKEKWRAQLTEPSIYTTSFDFSVDDRFLAGPVSDKDKIWVALWNISQTGSPEIKIPVEVGDFFALSPELPEVFVTNPDTGLRKYDAITKQTIQVGWGKNFAYYDFAPNGKIAVGVELMGDCKPKPGASQQNTGRATDSSQSSGSTVRVVEPTTGKEGANFNMQGICVQNFDLSEDSRYLLTMSGTPAEGDHPTLIQLWDLSEEHPTLKAEIRNGAPVLDAGLRPDSHIVLLDKKHFIATPWQLESLEREFCSRMIPDSSEAKDYHELCPTASELPAW